MRRLRHRSWVLLGWMALATHADATEGRIEINHARALAGGVTAEDAPGYPVTISESGSYRLTGNLAVPDANTHGIEVKTAAPSTVLLVSLDLSGFEIAGPTLCTRLPSSVSCAPLGTGDGITSDADHLLRVENGTIRGVGNEGLKLFANSVARGLRVLSTGGPGISSGDSVTIADCEVSSVGNVGISTGSGSLVLDNRVEGTHGAGILVAGVGTLVSGNAVLGARSNAGIQGLLGSVLIADNEVRDAVADGVNLGLGAPSGVAGLVSGNAIAGSGGDGVQTIRGALLLDNSITDSASRGVLHTNAAGQGFPPEQIGFGRNALEGNTGNVVNFINVLLPFFSTDLGGNACEGGC